MSFFRVVTLVLLGATITSDSRGLSVMASICAIVYIVLMTAIK
jgi:hypothetical protein